MHVPAWPVYPDQTPAGVAQAFAARSLAGLGDCDFESGVGCDNLAIPPTDPGTDVSLPAGWACDASGNCYQVSTPGNASGQVVYQNAGTAASPNYVPVLQAAAQGAIDIAKLLAVQPGTVQQGSTTLRQNPGFGVPTPATSTGVKVQASTGGSILIAAGVAIAAAILLFGRKG